MPVEKSLAKKNTGKPRRIADVHCDLLAYLHERPGRFPYDVAACASIPQLVAGSVGLQVLAIFGMTGSGSARIAPAQARLFAETASCPELAPVRDVTELDALATGTIGVVAAIENASTFCEEGEPLAQGLRRFEEIEARVGRILYVSLTWSGANRFGGGDSSPTGLLDDGRRLLDFLADKGRRHKRGGRRIALDLSHASPAMAVEALEHIDREALDLPVMASHSCFASLVDIPRNIRDDVVREIVHRGGIVGLNFLAAFLGGKDEKSYLDQVRHARHLGAAESYCLGADYFAIGDVPDDIRKAMEPFYFPGYEDASSYPRLLDLLATENDATFIDDLAWNNFHRFFARLDD